MIKKYLKDKLGYYGFIINHSEKEDGTKDSLWKGGGAYAHFNDNKEINFQWAIPTKHWGISFTLNDEKEIKFSFCGLYLTFDRFLPEKARNFIHEKYKYESKELSISYCDDYFHWEVWTSPDSWDSKTPKWRKGGVFLSDTFFGKAIYSKQTLEEDNVIIRMPEKDYPAKVTLFESTWKRPRFKKPVVIIRGTVDLDEGIPIPGKGEDSWNIEDTAITSFTCPSNTIQEVITTFIKDINRTRNKYGGPNWKPTNNKSDNEEVVWA